MKKVSVLLIASVLLIFGSALAQDTVDFEGLTTGINIEGLGVAHTDLNINALYGAATVIETGSTSPQVYGARNCPTIDGVGCPAGGTSYFHPNNCLENSSGVKVDNYLNPGETAKGFAAVISSGGEVQQDMDFTFGPDVSVCEFSVRMFDFGDYNPTHATSHIVTMSGYDASNALIDSDALSFTSDNGTNPHTSNLFTDLWYSGDACTANLGDPGYREFKVEGAGITRVALTIDEGSDPKVGFDSIRFCKDTDRITYTWLIDKAADLNTLTLAPGETYQMGYTVTVTPSKAGDCCTANPLDECVDISDTYYDSLGTACVNGAKYTYTREIGPYEVCGTYTVENTASFLTNDTSTRGSDSETITVNVPCSAGCTLTQGYWKNHSEFGPAPYDDTWAKLSNGASTVFYLSGQSWYQVLQTPPKKGNVYYILAHQYIAAKLNLLNGASSTADVDEAIAWAESFFNTNSPSTSLSKDITNMARSNASLLDQYNNGNIGPEHCSE
jgi:hypothetical protein